VPPGRAAPRAPCGWGLLPPASPVVLVSVPARTEAVPAAGLHRHRGGELLLLDRVIRSPDSPPHAYSSTRCTPASPPCPPAQATSTIHSTSVAKSHHSVGDSGAPAPEPGPGPGRRALPPRPAALTPPRRPPLPAGDVPTVMSHARRENSPMPDLDPLPALAGGGSSPPPGWKPSLRTQTGRSPGGLTPPRAPPGPPALEPGAPPAAPRPPAGPIARYQTAAGNGTNTSTEGIQLERPVRTAGRGFYITEALSFYKN
jgi:hypothetical protein